MFGHQFLDLGNGRVPVLVLQRRQVLFDGRELLLQLLFLSLQFMDAGHIDPGRVTSEPIIMPTRTPFLFLIYLPTSSGA